MVAASQTTKPNSGIYQLIAMIVNTRGLRVASCERVASPTLTGWSKLPLDCFGRFAELLYDCLTQEQATFEKAPS